MFSNEDIDILEGFLLRVRSEAASKRSDAIRLHGAYADKRAVFEINYNQATGDFENASRLIALIQTLRPTGKKN